jgi:hypothetical protein
MTQGAGLVGVGEQILSKPSGHDALSRFLAAQCGKHAKLITPSEPPDLYLRHMLGKAREWATYWQSVRVSYCAGERQFRSGAEGCSFAAVASCAGWFGSVLLA